MLSGSIIKGLFAIALPIMIMNVVQSVFNIVDMTVLEIFGGEGDFAVGAVGTCGTLITLATGLLIGMSAGVNVVIAKHVGLGDREKAEEATGTALLFSFVGGLALMVIGILFAENFLVMMNCPEEILAQATLYLRLYSAGVPILMVYNFSAAILRSVGDTKRPMIFLLSGGVIKLVFNFIFVAVFDMSVDGVAFATIISWSVSAFLCIYALIKNDSIVKFKLKRFRFYGKELKEILFIGVPSGVQQALYSLANVIISSAVNTFGAQAATGIAIANNFDGILYQISTAAALAVMPYVSQNIAVGNTKRANNAVRDGIIITVILGTTFGALSAIFSASLSSIMSSDPAVIAFSRQKMIRTVRLLYSASRCATFFRPQWKNARTPT